MSIDKPVPVDDDIDTRGFFDAAKRGAIAVKFCSNCERILHLPTPYCSACGSFESEWRDVSSNGTVYSWTVLRQQVHPGFPAPYTVALVSLDDLPGVRYLTYLEGCPELKAGMPMVARFDDVRDGVVVPQWVPAE